jgi:hypothetical protein
VLALVFQLVFPVALYGNPADDAWLDAHEETQTTSVNEGALSFLEQPPTEAVHAHHNRITLSGQSLHDGWAGLYQCHTDLDPVPAAEVVFNPGRVRHLQVEKVTGIERAWVEGVSVQLEGVTPGAGLCLSGETRVVVLQPGGGFQVRNGPFMRRFLDGFYPMHVRLEIVLPPGDWRLVHSQPPSQPGFKITRTAQGLDVDAWFEGELRTEFHFAPAGHKNRMNQKPGERE